MFYSIDLLSLRKNRRGVLPKCWIAGTHNQFIGRERPKLTKKEVEGVDVVKACDQIIESIMTNVDNQRFSLFLSATLSYGVIRIHLFQVNSLSDQCLKLWENIDKPPEVVRISQKIIMPPEPDMITDQQIIDMFPQNRVDKNLITEVTIPPLDNFGELSFAFDLPPLNEIREFRDISTEELPDLALLFQEPPNLHQISQNPPDLDPILQGQLDHAEHFEAPIEPAIRRPINGDIETRESRSNFTDEPENAVPTTPKRKRNETHDGTPSKKQKHTSRTTSVAEGESTSTSSCRRSGLPNISFPSEAAKSPVGLTRGPRRSLFTQSNEAEPVHADTADVPSPGLLYPEAQIPDDESTAHLLGPVSTIEAQHFTPPTDTLRPILPQAPRVSSGEDTTPELINKGDRDIPQIVIEEQHVNEEQGTHVEEDIPQVNPPPMEKEQSVQESLELQEIMNIPKTRRRSKFIPVKDDTKQIKIDGSFNPVVFTKPKTQVIVTKKSKIPAKNLFILPSTGLKIGNSLKIRNPCDWAQQLQENFFEAGEIAYQKAIEASQKKFPRDAYVNKRRKYSSFKIQSSTEPSSSLQRTSKSGLQETSTSGVAEIGAEGMFKAPYPPPSPPNLPSNEPEIQDNLPISTRSRSDLAPIEYEPEIQQDVPVPAHSRSDRSPTEYEPEIQQDFPVPADSRPEHPSTSHVSEIVDNIDQEVVQEPDVSIPHESGQNQMPLPSSVQPDVGPKVVDIDEFLRVLKGLWGTYKKFNPSAEIIEIELDDIVIPTETTIEQLIVYLDYLSYFEQQKICYLQQDGPDKPIKIIQFYDRSFDPYER